MNVRPARPTDQSYVAHSWQASARIPNGVINSLLDSCTVLIAAADHDADRILGWVAYQRIPGARLLAYALVRRSDRGQGIGTALLTAAGFLCDGPAIVALCDCKLASTVITPGEYAAVGR